MNFGFGFIVLRHVNSEITNKYWNQCVKLIRIYYPNNKIIIIDDNSDYKYIKSDFDYRNISIIKSEYPKRGELLPYIYYLRNKWFENAVILHDSTFINSYIPFEDIRQPVIPLWHFVYDKENMRNLMRITSQIPNNYNLINKLQMNVNVLGMSMPITG